MSGMNGDMVVGSLMAKSSKEACEKLPTERNFRVEVGNLPAPSSSVEQALKVFRLHADRDVCKGSTDTPRGATRRMIATLKLNKMVLQNALQRQRMRKQNEDQ